MIKFSDLEGSDFGRFEAAMLTRQILGRGLVCEKFHKKVWFFYSLIPTGVLPMGAPCEPFALASGLNRASRKLATP